MVAILNQTDHVANDDSKVFKVKVLGDLKYIGTLKVDECHLLMDCE